MNIFLTDPSPVVCAQSLDDKRVNKMTIETAQILSTVAHRYGVPAVYASTHENHPCTLWAGETRENFVWVLQHGISLAQEWAYRRGKEHGSFHAILKTAKAGKVVPAGRLTLPPNCTQFKRVPNVLEAYQHALNWKWFHDVRPPQWTNRSPPVWAKFTLADLVRPDEA